MPTPLPRLRAAVVGISVFALAAVAAGGAFAASNPATLYACYDTYGNVRLSDVAQCKLPGGGRLVYWSTAGVPGPTGATGPTGSTGATGPTGPVGSPTVYKPTERIPIAAGDSLRSIIRCNAGDIVTGGGFLLNQSGLVVRGSFPWDYSEAWTVDVDNPTGAALSYDVYAVCQHF